MMHRYIDADKADKTLHDLLNMTKQEKEAAKNEREYKRKSDIAAGIVLAINALRDEPKVEIANEPTVDIESVKGWISVKERLPENDGEYIVWCRGKLEICDFDAESQTFGYIYDDYDEMYSHLVCWDDLKGVTHWMSLPKPSKEMIEERSRRISAEAEEDRIAAAGIGQAFNPD